MNEAAAEQMWLAGAASSCSGHHRAGDRRVRRRASSCGNVCGVTRPPQAYDVLGTSLRIVGELDDAAQLPQRGIACLEPGSPSAAALYSAASVVVVISCRS